MRDWKLAKARLGQPFASKWKFRLTGNSGIYVCPVVQRWSMDFVSERLVDGRWFRILTIVDQYTRECLCLYADRSQTGEKVSEQLERLSTLRGAPEPIPSDNGSEFTGKAMDLWAHQAGVKLNFIRPGKPVENSYIESFNGRLRDECLNVEVFLDLADARRKLDKWRNDYNQQRPHSALADRTPHEFASVAMQLSFALSAAERAKDLAPEVVWVERLFDCCSPSTGSCKARLRSGLKDRRLFAHLRIRFKSPQRCNPTRQD